MNTYYIHYTSKTMDPCSPEKSMYKEAKANWLCTGCCSPKPGVQKVDVCIQDEQPDGPLNIVSGCGVALGRRSFLTRFGEERVAQHLRLGEVRGPDDQLVPDWVTFIGRHLLFVRGSKDAQHRVCSDCGQNLYFGMGKRYLYPQPPKGVDLFQSHLWGLIVPGYIGEMLGIDESDGVWIEKLPVLDKPLDGLPAIVSNSGDQHA